MILDKVYPPDPRVENEASFLVSKGHTVYLYAFDFESTSIKSWNHKGFEVRNYPMPSWLTKAYALAYTIPWYHRYIKKSLLHFIENNPLDAIHIHDIQIARAVFWLKDKFDGKIVLDLHENRPEIMKYYEHVNSLAGKLSIFPALWKKFESKYIIEADKVVVVTKEAASHYCSYLDVGIDKFLVVPNTVRKSFYSEYTTENDPKNRVPFKILYIGDTGSRRGLITTFKAIKKLVDNKKAVHLDVVGSSRFDAVLRTSIEKMGLQDAVTLHGWQNFEKFPSFINSTHVGICPIHRNVHHDTTFANKIFQYLSYGKPIIVSDCPPQKEIAEKYQVGLCFEDRNVEDLSRKILKLIEDSSLYESYRTNAFSTIKDEWNWENKAQVLANYYSSIED